jgi:hypothetical protein
MPVTKLTQEQKEFLDDHGISLGSVFDARGMTRQVYHDEMKALGKVVAIGVTPCAREGHSIRSRHGHCIVCNPATLVFQERWDQDAFVYVAGSLSLRVVKIGFASDVENRITSLRVLGYAGADDWMALYWVETKHAGHHEYKAQQLLKIFAAPTKYVRDDREVDCLETFACDATHAIDAVRSVTSPIIQEWMNEQSLEAYCFKRVSGGRFVRKTDDRARKRAKPLVRARPKQRKQSAEQRKALGALSGSAETPLTVAPEDVDLYRAAKQGDAEAQYTLGEIYLDGLESDGVYIQQDYAESLKWCRLAAEQGHTTAQCQLAMMYLEGKGVPENPAAALRWYWKAAAGDYSAEACFTLANLYFDKRGVRPYVQEAYAWATIALLSRTYFSLAVELRNKLEVLLLNSNQLSGAIVRVSELLEEIRRAQQANPLSQEHVSPEKVGIDDGSLATGSSAESLRGFTVACPSCGKLNRMIASRADRDALCGHSDCRARLIRISS